MIKSFEPSICIVGLGYVGLPLAVEFARNGIKVFGVDVNSNKIEQLKAGVDICGQISREDLGATAIEFSNDPEVISKANFVIVSVPTPIDKHKKPDLSYLESASEAIGKQLAQGSYVVYESTVYPGVTEEICLPILEHASGMKCGKDFFIGYSPERVNPGDKEHTIENIVKVVSGMDRESTEVIADVYGKAIKAGIFKAKNIKTAEAAKVIENIQRDLNIALINELAIIFSKLGIRTNDVIDAASTKWNFHRYHAGLVGGHCIGIDPYYLVYKAQELGYDPQVLLAGRKINESMAGFVVDSLVRMIIEEDVKIKGARVLVMGLTFKENINDVRNSKAKDVIIKLKDYGMEVIGCEPYVEDEVIKTEFEVPNIVFEEARDLDALILFNAHREFEKIRAEDLRKNFKGKPVIFDVKNFFNKEEMLRNGFAYKEF